MKKIQDVQPNFFRLFFYQLLTLISLTAKVIVISCFIRIVHRSRVYDYFRYSFSLVFSFTRRNMKITDRFTCTSANVISCITCTLCKEIYTGETERRLGDYSRKHLRDFERNDKGTSKPISRHFHLPGILGKTNKHTIQINACCQLRPHNILFNLHRLIA